MVDWKNAKGSGPWNFVPQGDKWGYLNNPRWHNPARPFVRGGSDDYSGRESSEPQVWTPATQYKQSKGTTITHHQCGHWHLKESEDVEVFEGFTYKTWFSCPQFILPSPTIPGQVWYITSLDKEPIDPMYVIEYSSSDQYWIERYNYNHTGVEAWEHWQEPDGSVYQRGDISVVAFIGNDDDVNGSAYYLETWVFDGNMLLNHTITPAGSSYPYGQIIISNMDAKFCVIDNSGNIHVVLKTYKSGVYYIYDFISSNNGASFTAVMIASGLDASYGNFRDLGVFTDGTLYLRNGEVMYKSINNGVTWSVIGSISGYVSSDTMYANDTFFILGTNTSSPYTDIILRRGTNGITYTTVLTVYGLWTTLAGCHMLYDGTYYYLALMFRDAASGLTTGYTRIYRSSDGLSWGLISTIVDEADIAVPSRYITYYALFWPLGLVKSGGNIFYSFYYAEMSASDHGSSDVYLMVVWKSSDNGVTWEVIYTPYYDTTRAGSQPPEGPWGELDG